MERSARAAGAGGRPMGCAVIAWASILAACSGAGEPVPVPTGGSCRYEPIAGEISVGRVSWDGAQVSVGATFRAPGSPRAAEVPGLYREVSHPLPCAQCVAQLGIEEGGTMPATASVAGPAGGCAPFLLEPFRVESCDCSAPAVPLRVASVTRHTSGPTLPLDPSGSAPSVPPPSTVSVEAPHPLAPPTGPFPLALSGSAWSCDVRFAGTDGRAESVTLRCEREGREPVEASATCDSRRMPLARLETESWPELVFADCLPDFRVRP